MKVTEQVAQFAEPVVQAHGCTLWDVEYVREGGEWFLRLYIDKDGGVTIDTAGTTYTFQKNEVAQVRLHVEF